MTRTVQEHWQLIEDLLRKKHRNRSEGEQLQEGVAGLLATPEGRESIRSRLTGDGKFEGKYRFVDEIFRALEKPVPEVGEMSPHDRLAILEIVLERTRPSVDSAHWNMLWLLHRDGNVHAGRMVLESLAKVSKKGDDLLRILPHLQAWERVTPDRIVSLLEAAKRASLNGESIDRIGRLLVWATDSRTRKKETDSQRHRLDLASSTDGAASLGSEMSSVLVKTSGIEQSRGQTNVISAPAVSPVANEPPQTLPMLFKAIEQMFKRQEGDKSALEREQIVTREELGRISADLQAQKELTADFSSKVDRLEHSLNDRTRDLATSRDRVKQLEQQLAEARQEVESAHRRSEDYIHEATLARDNAVRGFQASLWDRLRIYLIEILDGNAEQAGLTPDQIFFRHRLQEIRDVLRELGVPPY